ncbi:MAG TPA: hypothetical protein G4O02_09470 [Caldilineae bacterium]|nr:hypothetical protein [Caldilineae bacterium]
MPFRKSIGPTWKPDPKDIIIVTNTSGENLALHLPTGRMRLEAGRSRMMMANTLELPEVKGLLEAGKITWKLLKDSRR